MNNDKLIDAFAELTIETEALMKELDAMSAVIVGVEKKLKESRAHFPYKHEISNGHALAWDKDERSKEYRLLIWEEAEIYPIAEASINKRLYYLPHLADFVTNFAHSVHLMRSSIKSRITLSQDQPQ